MIRDSITEYPDGFIKSWFATGASLPSAKGYYGIEADGATPFRQQIEAFANSVKENAGTPPMPPALTELTQSFEVFATAGDERLPSTYEWLPFIPTYPPVAPLMDGVKFTKDGTNTVIRVNELAVDPAEPRFRYSWGTMPRGTGNSWDGNPKQVVQFDLFVPGCYADLDQSTGVGVLDVFDFIEFQNLYTVGDPLACNLDTSTGIGVCDAFDLLKFQDLFLRIARSLRRLSLKSRPTEAPANLGQF